MATIATGQNLRVTTTTAPVDVLTISDVDFVNSTTPKWLFTIDIVPVAPVPGGVEDEDFVSGVLEHLAGSLYAGGGYAEHGRGDQQLVRCGRLGPAVLDHSGHGRRCRRAAGPCRA